MSPGSSKAKVLLALSICQMGDLKRYYVFSLE
ncbi:hypothetical protein E2C01_062807 [Portunus trituberculatus]|uniref:Uncharacterized protein n=1 Tax=Portunus trituberculatus TaxID=210409 RepID=A0A5B7HGF5_PORTR|nr:hypothetical protein [Portunus trituberculatus]